MGDVGPEDLEVEGQQSMHQTTARYHAILKVFQEPGSIFSRLSMPVNLDRRIAPGEDKRERTAPVIEAMCRRRRNSVERELWIRVNENNNSRPCVNSGGITEIIQ